MNQFICDKMIQHYNVIVRSFVMSINEHYVLFGDVPFLVRSYVPICCTLKVLYAPSLCGGVSLSDVHKRSFSDVQERPKEMCTKDPI